MKEEKEIEEMLKRLNKKELIDLKTYSYIAGCKDALAWVVEDVTHFGVRRSIFNEVLR